MNDGEAAARPPGPREQTPRHRRAHPEGSKPKRVGPRGARQGGAGPVLVMARRKRPGRGQSVAWLASVRRSLRAGVCSATPRSTRCGTSRSIADDLALVLKLLLWTGAGKPRSGGCAGRELTDGIWALPRGAREKPQRVDSAARPADGRGVEAWPRDRGARSAVRPNLLGRLYRLAAPRKQLDSCCASTNGSSATAGGRSRPAWPRSAFPRIS